MAMFNSKCNTLPEGIPWIPQGSAAESAAAVAIRGSAAFRHVAFAAAAARRHEAWHVGHHGECWAWVDDMAMGCWNKPFKFLGYILALWFLWKASYPMKNPSCLQLPGPLTHGRVRSPLVKAVRAIRFFISMPDIHIGPVWRWSPVSVVDAMWMSWTSRYFTCFGPQHLCQCITSVRIMNGMGCTWDFASTATS